MNVLVVDDEPVVRRSLDLAIRRAWCDARIATVGSLAEAERALAATRPDVVTVDSGLPPDPSKLRGLHLVERVVRDGCADHAVVVTAHDDAIDAAHPARAPELCSSSPSGTRKGCEAGRQLGIPLVGKRETIEPALASLIGCSKAMRDLEAVRRVDRSRLGRSSFRARPVPARELVARAIHGLRGKGPFDALNCSTLEGLAHSQLFGHARGAFTSAERAARGAIEQAGEGVLFLDEIVDLPKSAQAKLLRVLERSPFQAVGGKEWMELMARLVSASHEDLEGQVAEGRFREDLFYRVAVHVIRVPPLRERTKDIPALVHALVQRLAHPKRVTENALAFLMTQRWPGNVRELAGFLQRAAVRTDDDTIDADDAVAVARVPLGSTPRVLLAGPVKVHVAPPLGPFDLDIQALTQRHFQRALVETNGNVAAAARSLGVDRMVVVRWLQKRGCR